MRGARPQPGLGGLLRLAAPERRLLAVGGVLALLQAAAALAAPALAGRLAGELFGARAPAALAGVALALAGLLALHAALGVASPWLLDRAEARIARRLRGRLHARLQRARLAWLEARRSGELTGLFAMDVETAAAFAGQLPVGALALGATAVGAFALMARLDPVCALAVAGAGLPVALVTRLLAAPVAVRAGELAERHAVLLGRVQEGLANALALRLHAAAGTEAARLAEAEEALAQARERHLRGRLLAAPVHHVVAGVGALGLMALAALRPGAPALAGGELVSLVLYAAVGTRPLLGLASLYMGAQQAVAALARVEAAARAPAEARPGGRAPARPVRGVLELRGVHLARDGRAVLRGADLRLAPGELVALVGPNGAGKTSLARLAVRLLEPDAGEVRLDGVPLERLDPEALRRHVVLASQETQLLDRTVRENLALGLPSAREEALWEALERAGAHRFVRALPRGLDTPVGEAGVRLSGGQRQRIALARALLRDPRVLVLDEATSMFDAAGERAFLRDQATWLRSRAVLLVTHRPASLAAVDRVLRLRAGRVQEVAPRRAAGAARRAPAPRSHARPRGPTPRSTRP